MAPKEAAAAASAADAAEAMPLWQAVAEQMRRTDPKAPWLRSHVGSFGQGGRLCCAFGWCL